MDDIVSNIHRKLEYVQLSQTDISMIRLSAKRVKFVNLNENDLLFCLKRISLIGPSFFFSFSIFPFPEH